MRAKPVIEVENLVKNYVKSKVVTRAVNGISFTISQGEFVGIMGPSGSGKSTTLHQLGLLDNPTSGEIRIDGVRTNDLSEAQKSLFRLTRFGYIFQEYRNLPEMTATENVSLPLMMSGHSPRQCRAEARKMLEMVGLGHRLSHRPFELSGGEQQRVALARAMVHRPRILFADEPTANLDSASGRTVLEIMKRFNETLGQTIVMVTHEVDHIPYFNRLIRMKDGKIVRETFPKKRTGPAV